MSDRNHILLSYSNQERHFALKLAVDLKNAGINLWMDRLDIELGADWRKSLQEGIDNSVAVLAVLSESSVHSQYCQRELARADRLGHPIIPILLTPIPKPDWPIEIERRQFIDFTQWQSDTIYQRQLERLVAYLKEKFGSQNTSVPDPESRYLTSLIATLKERNSLHAQVEPDMRPEPFSTFEWNLETDNMPRKQTGMLVRRDTLADRRTSLTNRILRNFSATGRLVLLGAPGTGKTSLLEYLCLKFAHQRQLLLDVGLLPILVHAADWDDGVTFAEFVTRAIPFDVDFSHAVVLVDGLDDLGPDCADKIAQIRDWMDQSYRIIISCRSDWFEKQPQLHGIPTVTAYDLALRQVRVFLTSLFSAQRAARILDEYPGKYLQPVLCNPRFLNVLANINQHTPLENVGAALRRLVETLIQRELQQGGESAVSSSDLEYALARLAVEDKATVPYEHALRLLGGEAALTTGVRAGLLFINGTGVRFTYQLFRSYFAAVWMNQAAVAWQSMQSRNDFYLIFLCLAGISSTPDDLVISIYHEYPELAINCLVTDVSVLTVKRVLSYWLRIGQSLDLPMLTHVNRLPEALVSMMREETWSIRQTAHGILQMLPVDYMGGIVEMLNLDEEEREDAALAIRQIGTRALPTLIQHLEHPDASLRQNVVWALDELSDKACVPGLVQALGDDDPAIVTYAIQALGYLHDPDSFPALIAMLGHNDADVRQTAFDTLSWVRESAIDALIDALDHSNPFLRQQAVRLLAESPADNVTEALLKATYDTALDVRLEAIAALKGRESPETIERLQECLQDAQLQAAAQEVLQHYRSPASRSLLRPTSSNGKRSSAEIAKERIKQAVTANTDPETSADLAPGEIHSEIVDGLLERLRHSEWGEREEAAKALRDYARTLHGDDALHIVDKLTPLLDAENWVLRWAVVEPLAWIGHESSVPHLIALLEDENWMVRVAAIRALQELKAPEALEAIETRLHDENSLVREAALEALGRYGDARFVSSIAALLDDGDEILRVAAVQALGQIHHKSTVGPLVKALNDSDKYVRWMAVDGLRTVADTSAVNGLIQRLGDTEKPHWEQERICDIAASILERIGTSRATEAVSRWQQRQQTDADSSRR